MVNHMKKLLFCLLLLPAFVIADISIEHHIPPPTNGFQGNNYTYNGNSQSPVITVNKSPSKSHFNGTSSRGGNMVGGRPINATVNNGYGDPGKINTQAASTYSKLGGIRGAANGIAGKALIALALVNVGMQGYDIGSNLWPIIDNAVYDTPMPPSNRPPPAGAPASPSSQNSANWKQPAGGYDPTAPNMMIVYVEGNPYMSLYICGSCGVSGGGDPAPAPHNWFNPGRPDQKIPVPENRGWTVETYINASKEMKDRYANISYDKVYPGDFQRPYTQEDFFNDLIWNLEHQPQDIATAIMNALHDAGVLGAPDSTVFDPASYTSPPYTAADTGLAQQDKFTLNQDGSMTHQVVQRPDLQGNSQLAPEKQPSTNPTNPTDPTTPTDPKPETPEIDWDMPVVPDTAIPTQEIPIFFAPDNTFNTNGVCPQPKTFAVFDHTFEISYQPMCDVAGIVRPVVILCGILLSMLMVFSALNGGKEA